MLNKNKLEKPNINTEKITKLFGENYFKLISSFYEMQSDFFRTRYKIHKNLEISIEVNPKDIDIDRIKFYELRGKNNDYCCCKIIHDIIR